MIVARKQIELKQYYGHYGRGVQCPDCRCVDTRVVKSRRIVNRVVRTRVCRACGKRWKTYEQ